MDGVRYLSELGTAASVDGVGVSTRFSTAVAVFGAGWGGGGEGLDKETARSNLEGCSI